MVKNMQYSCLNKFMDKSKKLSRSDFWLPLPLRSIYTCIITYQYISITYSIMYHFSYQFDKHSAVDLLIILLLFLLDTFIKLSAMCFLFIGQILGVHERDELPPSAPMVSCLVLCPPRTGSELQAFFGEVLPEAWPPRIIPRDDQQVLKGVS